MQLHAASKHASHLDINKHNIRHQYCIHSLPCSACEHSMTTTMIPMTNPLCFSALPSSLDRFNAICLAFLDWWQIWQWLDWLPCSEERHSQVDREHSNDIRLVPAKEAEKPRGKLRSVIDCAPKQHKAETANNKHERFGVRRVEAVVDLWRRPIFCVCNVKTTQV